MKRFLIAALVTFGASTLNAQLQRPMASPLGKIEQKVGLTDIKVEYSRPSKNNRVIFGDVVPFNELWRTGANENSIISFSDDVVIDGKTLAKGKYALFTIPKADEWEVVFYSVIDNWGTPEIWDETKVALRTNAKSEIYDNFVESFTISIDNLDLNFAVLEFSWEKTHVTLKFEVPTKNTAIANIEKVLSGPSAGDYFSSAQYLFQSNVDLEKALTYVDKALEMKKEKPFWYYRLKSLIQAKLGAKKEAIETAKLSLAAAEIAKNQDYIKMNKESIEEWSKK